MSQRRAPHIAWLWPAVLVALATAQAQPPDATLPPAPWEPADPAEVRAKWFAWLEESGADDATRAKATALWPVEDAPAAGTELLARLVDSAALARPDARKLVALSSKPSAAPASPSKPWTADAETPPWLANNLRLWCGRWLAQHSLFDEAAEQLAGLEPGDVVDPATLLFSQAVVGQRLLDKEAATRALDRLLAGAEQSPRRYAAVARLMQADLKDLKPDSLDHIARRMDDVRRRLGLGRAGPKVRKIEDGVIESLDKMIKKLEDQQQQASSMSSGNMQPSEPAQESRIAAGKGRGEVTKRNIGSGSGWGDLPPRQREEALQQIGREFPSHYRDAIEQYFRKLANEGSP
jgi:hypothetical protein